MANLSNVDPLSGAVQGVTGGIQNAGIIQQLMQNRDKIARENVEAPLRTEALRQGIVASNMQNEVAGIDLAQKKRNAEMLNRPWNPAADPIFQQMDGPAKAEHLQMIKDFVGDKQPTIADRQAITQQMGENTKWFDYGTKVSLSVASKAAAEAKRILDNDEKDPAISPEDRAKHYADFNTAIAKVDGIKADTEKMRTTVAVREVVNKYPAIMQNPTFAAMAVLAEKTGDDKGLTKMLEVIETGKAKGIPDTAVEAYIQGRIKTDVAEGKAPNLAGYATEWEKIQNSPKEGTHYPVYENDQIKTKVFRDGKWITEGGGARWKDTSGKVSMTNIKYNEFITANPAFKDLPQALYLSAQDNQKQGLRPFKKDSYWDKQWTILQGSEPGASATGVSIPVGPPAGFTDSGKTQGGKKVYVNGDKAWVAP